MLHILVDKSFRLSSFNVWALCPTGYYLNGLRLGAGPPAYLQHIDEGQCCHPQGHPNSYEHCYDQNVSHSFNYRGWSECQQAGYYMTGFYKSSCNDIHCIEKFRCCKMKVLGCARADWQASLDRAIWSRCPNPKTYLRGLWRNDRYPGDERVGRIEYGSCCTATEPSYTNQPAACSNANWLHTLDG